MQLTGDKSSEFPALLGCLITFRQCCHQRASHRTACPVYCTTQYAHTESFARSMRSMMQLPQQISRCSSLELAAGMQSPDALPTCLSFVTSVHSTAIHSTEAGGWSTRHGQSGASNQRLDFFFFLGSSSLSSACRFLSSLQHVRYLGTAVARGSSAYESFHVNRSEYSEIRTSRQISSGKANRRHSHIMQWNADWLHGSRAGPGEVFRLLRICPGLWDATLERVVM